MWKNIFIAVITVLLISSSIYAVKEAFSVIGNNEGLTNSSVTVVFQDSKGMLWVGTWNGLNSYDGNNITQFPSLSKDTMSLSNPVIRDIKEEDNSHLWVTTDWGINRFDKRTGKFRRFYLGSENSQSYSENSFFVAVNKKGDVLAFHSGKFFVYDKQGDRFLLCKQVGAHLGRVHQMTFDSNNNLVVSTNEGIKIYSHLKGNIIKDVKFIELPKTFSTPVLDSNGHIFSVNGGILFTSDKNLKFHPTNIGVNGNITCATQVNKKIAFGTTSGYFIWDGRQILHYKDGIQITCLLFGTQDILWIGTDGHGLINCFPNMSNIITYQLGDSYAPVRAIMERGNSLLVGTKGNGLMTFNLQNDTLRLSRITNVGIGQRQNSVLALCQQKRGGEIWIGTDGEGLKKYSNGKVQDMKFLSSRARQMVRSVYSILQANDTTLYLGTSGNGIIRATLSGETITSAKSLNDHLPKKFPANIVYSQVLEYPYLWFGARGVGLYKFNLQNKSYRLYRAEINNDNSIVSNDIICLHRSSDGDLWIGTSQGLCKMLKENGKPKFITIGQGGTDKILNVHSIQEDARHIIWISTSNGIFGLKNNTIAYRLTYCDGLQGNEFSDGAGITYNKGSEICFGGINGISILRPLRAGNDKFMPKLAINKIVVDGSELLLEDKYQVESGSKMITFSFSVFDYINNDRCQLSYSLIKKGMFHSNNDTTWVMNDTRKSISFNELPPRHYELLVRQCNASHRWSSSFLVIPFNVSYPLWQRWWAVMLYFIVISLFMRYIYKRRTLAIVRKHRRELEKRDKKAREDIYHAKLNFFSAVTSGFSTNIMHIFNALEELRSHDSDMDKSIDSIDKNVRSMSSCIRQMVEIKSADEENSELALTVFNFKDAILSAMDDRIDSFVSKGIKIEFVSNTFENLTLRTDRTILLKILYYILNYIAENISPNSILSIGEKSDQNVELSIYYEGTKPTREEYDEIFSSYKAVDGIGKNVMASSALLGLTISNNLLKRIGGSLKITGNDNVTFLISLGDVMVKDMSKKEVSVNILDEAINNKDRSIILAGFDDNVEGYIARIINRKYTVITCNKLDIDKNVSSNTCLIVAYLADNDLAFINSLSSQEDYHYIPILGVCEQGMKDSLTDVLSKGVAALVEKPFTVKFFLAMVNNAVKSAERINDLPVTGTGFVKRYGSVNIADIKRDFVIKAVNILKEHYSEDNYSPNSLARDMTISRSQLYRKLKEAINMTPADFIIEYRMVMAENMLTSSKLTISEVINACGFRNRSFFYREFARRNHCKPNEYRNNGHNIAEH